MSSDDPNASRSRSGSGDMSANWAAKGTEVKLVEPLLRRHWLRRLVFCFCCAVGLGAAGAVAWFNHWHDARLAEVERQRACLQSFLHSDEFTTFARAMDAQLVATINFIAARPREAQPLLPAVAANDKARGVVPWPMQVVPLPVSYATDPAKVAAAGRAISALLVRHGFVLDENARKGARQLFLRTLVPFAQKFIDRNPGNAFHSVFLDRSMQEEALARFAALHLGQLTAAETERLFALYAAIGPALWQAIEQDRAARAGTVTATSKQ